MSSERQQTTLAVFIGSGMKTFRQFGNFLQARPHSVLIAVLGVLHLTMLTGVDTAVGPMCWLVDVGLFIIWQPFIQTGRRIDASALLLLVLALAVGRLSL